MTTDDLEKEAERIANLFYENLDDTEIVAENLRALRAVHARGFAEGIDEAANIEGDGRHCCEDCPCSGKAEEIRALKIAPIKKTCQVKPIKIGDGK